MLVRKKIEKFKMLSKNNFFYSNVDTKLKVFPLLLVG